MKLYGITLVAVSLIRLVIGATIEGYLELPGDLTNLDLTHTSIELLEITSNTTKTPIKRDAYINSKGGFQFTCIPSGEYLLSLSHIEFNLVPFKSRIDVDKEDQVSIHLVQAAQKWNELGPEIPHPIRVIPNTKIPERQYIKKRSPGLLDSGPLATIVNNPLYLVGISVLLIALAFPYILEKVDPETAKIMKEQKAQRSSTSTKSALKAAETLEKFDIGEKIGASRATKASEN